MARCYAVYLETAADGRCMAHALDLPGCIVRAPTRDEALRRLPDAVRDYHAWLRRHGESAPPAGEPVEVEVAAESTGFGPFDPGSAAALFLPDRNPVTSEEVEYRFRLMGHARADLLALVRDLPDDLLDWRPHSESFNIRRLLRHVGDAEEWYVSRLAPPETLPPEWEHDEDMPVFEFLEMERRAALACLRGLTEEERSVVHYPTAWTFQPEEPWTARKALRRFLEHEREHTAQVREILNARRRYLLARLAAERAGLLEGLLGLDEEALVEVPVLENWTIKDILAHIAAWDRWEDRTMRTMVAGEEPDFTAVQELDAANAAFVAERRDRTLAEVVAELRAARAEWAAWLENLPLEAFFRPRSYAGHDDEGAFAVVQPQVQWEHDAEHATQISAWQEAAGLKERRRGPKEVLLASLAAAREELMAAAKTVLPEERASRFVCGEWTLHDVLGHVADWEWIGVEGLRHMAAGRPPQVERVEDVDVWNQVHVEARRGQPWETAWDDLHAARQALLKVLDDMNQAELAQSFPSPWGPEITPYGWVSVFISHDREHARDPRGTEEVT